MNEKSSNPIESTTDNSMKGHTDRNGHSSSSSSQCKNNPIRKPNTKVSYEMMPGFHINSNILFCPDEQQFYRINTTKMLKTIRVRSYVCREDGCRCRVHIQNDECYISDAMAHDHGMKTQTYYNLCSLNEVKRILDSVQNKLSAKQVFDDVIKR